MSQSTLVGSVVQIVPSEKEKLDRGVKKIYKKNTLYHQILYSMFLVLAAAVHCLYYCTTILGPLKPLFWIWMMWLLGLLRLGILVHIWWHLCLMSWYYTSRFYVSRNTFKLSLFVKFNNCKHYFERHKVAIYLNNIFRVFRKFHSVQMFSKQLWGSWF